MLFHFSVNCRWCSCSESIQRGSGRNQESSSKQRIWNNLTGQYISICIIYRPSMRSRWLDIGQVLFLHFYGPRRSRGVYYIMIFHTFMSLCAFTFTVCLAVFVAKCILETHQCFCFLCFHSCWNFRSSCFLVSSRQITHRKSLFCEEKLSCTHLNFGKILLQEQNGQSWAGIIGGVWFILPAHGASRIINTSY